MITYNYKDTDTQKIIWSTIVPDETLSPEVNKKFECESGNLSIIESFDMKLGWVKLGWVEIKF